MATASPLTPAAKSSPWVRGSPRIFSSSISPPLQRRLPRPPPLAFPAPEQLMSRALSLGIRDYVRKCGFKSVILGLSGGIDSALIAVLAADAVGPENVFGVSMPAAYSSQGSLTDAEKLAHNLGIRYEVLPIEPAFKAVEAQLQKV